MSDETPRTVVVHAEPVRGRGDPVSDLLLEATPALLDGWCGPVMIANPAWAEAVLCGPSRSSSGAWLICRPWIGLENWGPEDIRLDLARAECRDRVARVLGKDAWLSACVTDSTATLQPAVDWHDGELGWPMGFWLGDKFWGAEDEGDGFCPALADLDPNDDTRLPDGSRLVDALALLYVARAVLS